MQELQRLLAAHRGDSDGDGGAQLPLFDDAVFRSGGYRDGALLRFRGVVRDVQDPELVLLAGAQALEEEEDAAAAVARFEGAQAGADLVERVPLKVALFPHRTPWAVRAFGAASPSPPPAAAGAAGVGRAKRSNAALDGAAADSNEQAAPKTPLAAEDALAKKPKADAPVPRTPAAAPFLPNLLSVYVYDGQYDGVPLDAFKVNEAFDFVGALDLAVLGAATRATADALSADELQRLQISEHLDALQQRQRSGAVVHCCAAAAVTPLHHARPHLPRSTHARLQASNAAKTAFCADEWMRLGAVGGAALAAVHRQLVQHLATAALGGDALAAEYLVLCLLSRVYSRPDAATPLGNLSLNLSGGSSARVAAVEAAICALVPLSATLDLALASLNARAFAPHKDYETDAMCPGELQVPPGTVLVVNETSLSAGQLNGQGVKNVGALQALVASMVLPYDFQFYSMDFPMDVAVVSVSEGKSILPVTVSLPLAPPTASVSASALSAAVTEPLLESFRVYLAVLRTLDVAIGNEQAEAAEQHYVACRQAKQEVSVDDLHRWLRLARLVALSQGEDVVSRAAWDRMLALEAQRLERLQHA